MRKRFLHKELIPNPSKRWLIMGLVASLLFSFALFSLFSLTLDILRVMHFSNINGLPMSAELRWKLRIFFAYIAAINGLSIFFIFLFKRPRQPFTKKNYLKISIINDQRMLNWYFLSWFSKLAIVIGVFFGLYYQLGYISPDLNDILFNLLILILIVLFLQLWVTIRHYYKNRSLKYFFASIIAIVCYSTLLVNIELIDHNKIEEIANERSIKGKYLLQLPVSDHYKPYRISSNALDLYIVAPKNNASDLDSYIILKDKVIDPADMYNETLKWYAGLNEIYKPFITCRLFIHHTISMDAVKDVLSSITAIGMEHIHFTVHPAEIGNVDLVYKHYVIPYKGLLQFMDQPPPPYAIDPSKIDIGNKILVDIYNSQLTINGEELVFDNLDSYFRELIRRDTDHVIFLYIKKGAEFNDFLSTYSAYSKAIMELQEEFPTLDQRIVTIFE